jgi:hypothetical protein
MARGEAGTGHHGRQGDLTEALTLLRPVERCYGLPEAVNRSTIIALGLVGSAEVLVCQHLLADLPAGRRECEGALSGGGGLGIRAPAGEMD